jgi:hypothetical protein
MDAVQEIYRCLKADRNATNGIVECGLGWGPFHHTELWQTTASGRFNQVGY